MLEQTLGDILKATATGAIVLGALVILAYAATRVRERWKQGDARAAEIVMAAVKPVTIAGKTAIVYGAVTTREAMYQWVPDSDGDGVPDNEDESPELDDRHRLLVELCRSTLQDEKYRHPDNRGRVMTADDAERLKGHFADRNNWQLAVNYGKEKGLIMTSNTGTLVKRGTVSDLLADLAQINPVLDSAVNALPEKR